MKREELTAESQDIRTESSGAETDSSRFALLTSLLKEYWGYDGFRGIQREIIESIMEGQDTLGLMPTGGGKSLTFQIPALAMEGVCIVITPLIALMKDQVQQLRRRGIQATAIYSGMSHQEILKALENSIFGGVKILYVSPERLSSELFLTKLRRIRVSFITVDEAHCISQWGYDFRPSYLEISRIRHLVNPGVGMIRRAVSSGHTDSSAPHPALGSVGQPAHECRVPILALTATATPRVVEDIQYRLEFRKPCVYKMSFERKNLAYVVRETSDKRGELLHILQAVSGSAVVYVSSRRRTKEMADFLNQHLSPPAGASAHVAEIASVAAPPPVQTATFYHAGLDHSVRDERQQQWQEGRVRVMVATNAFGMGIDKANVRLVVHMDCPSSLEAYFQEAGRAGRDGRKAYAVLLYDRHDRTLLERRITSTFPEKNYILTVYEHLAYYYQMAVGDGMGVTREFDIDRFCKTYRHFPVQVNSALLILSRAGWIHYETDPDSAARVTFLLSRAELYRLHETSPHEEAAITALLRCYGGLFTDYVYIDLHVVARQAHLTDEQTYACLKALSDRRVLHFIPQRRIPTITYTCRREETDRVVIPPSVYEERRDLFAKRIRAMWSYAEDHSVCRSRLLLRYFGEDRTHDCGQCDVCLSRSHSVGPVSKLNELGPSRKSHVREDWGRAGQLIFDWLADGRPHPISSLMQLGLPTDELQAALRHLLSEEAVVLEAEGTALRLPD